MAITYPHRSLSTVAHRSWSAEIAPNWFTSVMGTGIVATAATTLPVHVAGLHTFAMLVWLAAATALVTLSIVFVQQWMHHRSTARNHAQHPVRAQFYGAPPMAMLTVGAGTLVLGRDLIGASASVGISWVLWIVGTALGLATSVWIPFRMITAHDHVDTAALPAWLMPVVPPMVSASTGALLLPYVPAGQARLTMLLACYGMFGLSLIVGLITLTLVYSRLLHGGIATLQAAPTVWISLGVIGQSITAANLLGADAHLVFSDDQAVVASGLRVFGLLFGVVMGGFGVLFFALATALTVHAGRRGLTFSLTWWSFTFPVGTCVTAASALGKATGADAVNALSVALYVLLLTAWAVVAGRTALRAGERFVGPYPN